MRTTNSTRRVASLATAASLAAILLPSAKGTTLSPLGARRTVFYQDANCQRESFREYVYSARSVDAENVVTEVSFNKCYPMGSTGAITACNPSNGAASIETFLDTECQHHLHSTKDDPPCQNLKQNGHTCPPGGPGSSSVDCTSMRAAPSITPTTFNLVGSPYSDGACTERTGGDHVVPGHAFGVGNAICSLSSLVRGPLFSLSECMEDGSIFSKVYSAEDHLCSGDLHLEALMFPGAGMAGEWGGICAMGMFEDGRHEFYRLKSCTHDDATEKGPIGPTPGPTVAPPSAYSDDDEPAPAPIDYLGDGDDEDLVGINDDDGLSGDDYLGPDGIAGPGHGGGEGGGGEEHRGDDSSDSSDDDGGGEDSSDDDSSDDAPDDDGDASDDDGDALDDDGDAPDDDGGAPDDDGGHDDGGLVDDDGGHGDASDDGVDDGESSDDDCSSSNSCGHHGTGSSSDDDGDDNQHSDDSGPGDDDFDHGANPSGGGDSGDGGSGDDDGLSDNEVFAIAFGISTAVVICALSTLLALGGKDRQKIGPKPS